MKAWRAWAAGLLIALSGCSDNRVAGGTDEVENPALTALLRGPDGETLTGSMSVYARRQNPVRNPAPLLTLAAGENGAKLQAATLLAAMDSAAKAGLPWTSRDSVTFNLVAVEGPNEGFAGDYLLLRSGAFLTFKRIHPPETGGSQSAGSLITSVPFLPAIAAYKGTVGVKGSSLGLTQVFVPGSPYRAAVGADGAFVFERLAQGRYDVKAMDGGGKVWTAQDSLATDSATFAPADWSEADIIWID